jgi:HlyD family secretion protein
VAARSRKIVWVFILLLLVAGAAVLIPTFMKPAPPPITEADVPPKSSLGVASLGRIQPDEIVTVGARSLSGQPSLVGQLKVKDGDYVKAGQTIAILDSLPQLEAAWHQAESRVKVSDARLKQAMTGPKAADIAAQKAVISRLEAELANAKITFSRNESLVKSGIALQPILDPDRILIETLPHRIAEAKERLQTLEIRQVDVDVAKAELQAAETEVERTRVEAQAATIRAPYSGLVMKIHAWQGSDIGPKGILELARVDRMYVIAEVADSDIQRVKIGQRAKITGYSLPGPLEGQVERLGLKVSRNSLVPDNPVNLTDARIVEVKILLDDGSSVRNLIDGQVEVLITP